MEQYPVSSGPTHLAEDGSPELGLSGAVGAGAHTSIFALPATSVPW